MLHILKAGAIAALFFTGLALGRDLGTVALSKIKGSTTTGTTA